MLSCGGYGYLIPCGRQNDYLAHGQYSSKQEAIHFALSAAADATSALFTFGGMYTYDRAFKIMHIEYKDKIGVNLGEKQIFTGVHCFYGNRRVPQYLLHLMAYKIQMEKLADKKRENDKEDNAANK